MLSETQEELIRAAQNGNSAAFGRLLRGLEQQMLSVAAGLAQNAAEADDIYQDAMLAAYRALPRFKLESKFSTWLYRIVVNTALSRRRKVKRMLKTIVATEKDDNSQEQYACSALSPEEQMLNHELNEKLNSAMAKLGERERIAFVLCHQQGFKLREAAEMMSCSTESIKVTLFRARAKLKEQLSCY